MPRITLFANSLGHGGSERQAAFIGSGLLKRGWDVSMVCVLPRDDYSSDELRHRTHVLGRRGKLDVAGLIGRARTVIDPAAPIVCFNWYPHMLSSFAVPAAQRIVRFGGIPSADGVTGPKRVLARRAQKSALAVVGCSWGVTQRAVLELGDPVRLCAAIPNAVYQAHSEPEDTSRPWPRPYILAAGRLSAEKDHQTLVEAFSSVAASVEHDLLIAGDGAEEERIRESIAALGLQDRIHLLGYQKDLQRWLRWADLFVHTSRWEGFGIVLIEAMRQGVAVVATDAPYGPRAVLGAVPGGVLVPVGDAHAVAEQVSRLLHDDAERHRLGRIGRTGVPVAFDPERTLDAYEQVIFAATGVRS